MDKINVFIGTPAYNSMVHEEKVEDVSKLYKVDRVGTRQCL